MIGQVRVLLHHLTDDDAGITAAYHLTSKHLREVPGLLGNELLRSVHDPRRFVVVSSWRSPDAFREWESGPEHRDQTAPLRPFRDTTMRRPFGLYQVSAAYQRP